MKKIHIYGGGTFSYVRNHLALAMPAFGTTANQIWMIIDDSKIEDTRLPRWKMNVELHLTKMADSESELVTNEDVERHVMKLKEDMDTKVIFFNVGLCDYDGLIMEDGGYTAPPHPLHLKFYEIHNV